MLLARMAPGFTVSSRRRNTSFFRSMFSNTASMIRSQSAKAEKSSVGVSRPMAVSTASGFMRPRLAVAS